MKYLQYLILFFFTTGGMDARNLNRVRRVVGGTSGSIEKFPFLVSIQRQLGSHFCGGTVINKRMILSAAHCFEPDDKPTDLLISAGSSHFDKGVVNKIETIVGHPKYANGSEFDFAVLITTISFQFNKFIQPAQLPDGRGPQLREGDVVITAGWGRTRQPKSCETDDSFPESKSTKLKWVRVNIVNQTLCREAYPDIGDNVICAAAPGKDSCEGDSGGPLLQTNSSIVVGVVSGGYSCAMPEHPGLYSKIEPSVTKWIHSIVKIYL